MYHASRAHPAPAPAPLQQPPPLQPQRSALVILVIGPPLAAGAARRWPAVFPCCVVALPSPTGTEGKSLAVLQAALCATQESAPVNHNRFCAIVLNTTRKLMMLLIFKYFVACCGPLADPRKEEYINPIIKVEWNLAPKPGASIGFTKSITEMDPTSVLIHDHAFLL